MTITRIHRWRAALMLLLVASVLVMGQSPTPSPPKTPQRGIIKGKVVNETGQPLANARVLVMKFGSSRAESETITDREGKFEVDGLAAVSYRLTRG